MVRCSVLLRFIANFVKNATILSPLIRQAILEFYAIFDALFQGRGLPKIP
jgi:hypothetical protein